MRMRGCDKSRKLTYTALDPVMRDGVHPLFQHGLSVSSKRSQLKVTQPVDSRR